jgi:hypothetical protein
MLIEILWWMRDHDSQATQDVMHKALGAGSLSLESLQMLLRYELNKTIDVIEPLKELGNLECYERPLSEVNEYDILLLSGRIH